MIRLMSNSREDYRNWQWSMDPFPAFRATGPAHHAFLAVAKDFVPWFMYSESEDGSTRGLSDDNVAIIKTKKGNLLMVPSHPDERIALVTVRGPRRGGISRTEIFDGYVLYKRASYQDCREVHHLVVRFDSDNGYLMAETGWESHSEKGCVLAYTWQSGLVKLATEEYETAIEVGIPLCRSTIEEELATCQSLRVAAEESSQH